MYLDFQIYEGEHQGKTLRMFLRPSTFPTSNFYRAWSIARGGPPKSRSTKMSPRIFTGKLFRVLTGTVRPKHRIAGQDGKLRPGPDLPEVFWYSKVSCLLSLEVTNEPVLGHPIFVTDSSSKPFSSSGLSEGMVGRRELGDGNKQDSKLAARDGNTVATLHSQPVGDVSLPAPSPHVVQETLLERGQRLYAEQHERILEEWRKEHGIGQ